MSENGVGSWKRGLRAPWRLTVVALVVIGALIAQFAPTTAASIPIINEDVVSCPTTPGDPYLMPSGVCAAWGRLQDQAIARIVESSGLPNDRTLVLTRARSTVRAMLWAIVTEAAAKPLADRSADEKVALDWLGEVIHQHTIEVAQKALSMYDAFYAEQHPGPGSLPCTFTPPFPYQNEYPGDGKVREAFCSPSFFPDVFGLGVTNKPKASEWTKWANAAVLPGKFDATSGVQARNTAAQLGLLGAAAVAAVAATITVSLVAAQLIATSAFMASTFALGGVIVGGVTALAFAAFGLIVAAIGIAAAIYGAIIFFDNQRPDLETALAEAQKPFDMGTLLAKPQGPELAFTLFSGWLSRQPDPATPGPVPARVGSDPRFTVSVPGTPSTTPVDSFPLRSSNGDPATVTMQGGFWVITDPSGTTVTLDLPGIDAQGRTATIRRLRLADGSYGFQAVPPDSIIECRTQGSCPVTRQFSVFTLAGFRTIRYAGTQDGQDLPTLTFDFDKVSTTTIGAPAPFFAAAFDTNGARVPATISWELGDRCLTRYTSGCPNIIVGTPTAPDGSVIKSVGTTADLRYTFPTSGTWWMRAKATTSLGTVASNWFTVEVTNPAPSLSLNSPTGTVECSTSGNTTCPTSTVGSFGLAVRGTINDTALQYELENVTIDWGDGVVEWGDSGRDVTLCVISQSGGVTNVAPCVTFGTPTGDSVDFIATHRPAAGVFGARTAIVTVRDVGGNQVSLKMPYVIPDTRQTQTVNVTSVASSPWGTPIDLTATASTGLPVSLSASPSEWCVIDAGKLFAARVGTCTVTATQAGNATYQPATGSRVITLTKRPATISFVQPTDIALPADPATTVPLTVSAADATGAAPSEPVVVTSQTTDVCTVTNKQVSLLKTGSCTLVAAFDATSANWTADPVQRTFKVLRKQQTLTLFTPTLMGVIGGSAPVQASASSGLPVTVSASPASVCSIAPAGTAWTVTVVGAGDCVVTAQQAGDATWEPVTETKIISVTRDNQSSFIADAPPTIGAGASFTVRVGGSLGTPFVVAAGPSTVCGVNLAQSTVNPAGISTYRIDTAGGGSCVVTVNRAADAAYNAAPQQSATVLVSALTQTITFSPIADALVRGPAIQPVVSASSGLRVTVTSTTLTVCTLAANGTVNLIGAGTCTLTATQAGDSRYGAATPQTRSFVVGYRVTITRPNADAVVRQERSSEVSVTILDGRGRPADPELTRVPRCSLAVSVGIGTVAASCVSRDDTGRYVAKVDTRTVPTGTATVSATVTVVGVAVGRATTSVRVR